MSKAATAACERRHTAVSAVTAGIREILPPLQVIAQCRLLAEQEAGLEREVLGHSESGAPIELYRWGKGRHPVLFYGFPDPGEAIGGTGILALMRALLAGDSYLAGLDVSWSFFPCLNVDDQPEGGRMLVPVMRDPARRELDWCLDNPRPETRALLAHAAALQPVFTFPLHDEFHSDEIIPAYLGVSPRPLPGLVCDEIRQVLAGAGLPIDDTCRHATMGAGFLDPAERFPGDWPRSTFSVLASYGTVLICELSRYPVVAPGALVATQLEVGLIALAHVLQEAADAELRPA